MLIYLGMDKTVIKFWANGCGNCKALAPTIDTLAQEYIDINFESVNTADAEEAVEKYGVTSLPTLVFLNGSEMVAKMVGLKPKSLVERKLVEVFLSDSNAAAAAN